MNVDTQACTVVRSGLSYTGRQGYDYDHGISNATSNAKALCLHRAPLPPGARAVAHLHEDHESAIFVVRGRGEFWWGAELEHHELVEAGDYIHIPAGVPHVPYNPGPDVFEVVLARTDPNEQESVVTLPELDALPHLPRR
ncbi:cupin domain-containing protein [Solirubrobacter phytolaccae]|uniref:Cupin domain-containing protein n=1 Tax=Solirubrobacter phytolaccae TaxID=1404360 RepID=A0A9X3N5K3_9ACTN|nr:cupin domain-containing protein [Solirubrobacter phytolaccae]MDA0179866.1 cupin domain-containing protein [Solirubrobacter phytolaccae]